MNDLRLSAAEEQGALSVCRSIKCGLLSPSGSAGGRLRNLLDGKVGFPFIRASYNKVLIGMNCGEFCLQALQGLSCGTGSEMYLTWLQRARF